MLGRVIEQPSVSRTARAFAVVALVVSSIGVAVAPPVGAQSTPMGHGAPLEPADGIVDVTIERTSFGIPHVTARDWTSLGYGSAWAFAEDGFCLLSDYLLAARGERSAFLDPDAPYLSDARTNLVHDVLVTDLRDRGVVADLLDDPVAGPSDTARAIAAGYVAGYNDHLATADVTDPACAGADWLEPVDELDYWHLVMLSQLLASSGELADEYVAAAPPGAGGSSTGASRASLTGPGTDVTIAAALDEAVDTDAGDAGSNAYALGTDATDSGNGMLLGNPHFPWTGRNRFHQMQLTVPGVLDVAGGSLTGFPMRNIGFNADVAWSHTVSTASRFTPYAYPTVGDGTTYVRGGTPVAIERRDVTVDVGGGATRTETLYATPEGYVAELGGPLDWTAPADPGDPASFGTVVAIRDANLEHLQTFDVFLEQNLATSVPDLFARQDAVPGIPWVNTMVADRDGNAGYADNSVVPNVPRGVPSASSPSGECVVQQAGTTTVLWGAELPANCAWGTDDDAARPGILGPESLPDVTRDDYILNANDSYWLPNADVRLTGFDPILGCEACLRSERSRGAYRYVVDELARDGAFTLDDLAEVQVGNRVFAGELAREGGDLQAICAAATGDADAEACTVLAAWDGLADVDSVGAHVFREFYRRADDLGDALFEVPFDADDPVGTPRDLDEANPDVVAAMADALAFLDAEGIPLDAPLGELQQAADRGAFPYPVHGGLGDTGNGNVVDEGDVAEDPGVPYPIARGTSHVQAVHLTDDGPVARTILTYGNAEDPTSPHHDDQTALWAQERWVSWPFTRAERLADPGYRASRITRDDGDTAPTLDVLSALADARDPGRTDDPTAPVDRRVDRVAGAERIATSVQVSRRTRATADVAVLARADVGADALVGAPVAAALGGPLLLSGAADLDDGVLGELERLGVADVVLLGGEAALSAGVAEALEAAGLDVDRVAGADRYATSAAVAERYPGAGPVVLARGDVFADATSAAGLAGQLGGPVLLTTPTTLPEATAAALDGRAGAVLVGGEAAIGTGVADAVGPLVGGVVDRLAGADRYATSRAVLERVVEGGTPGVVPVATGTTFPDGLVAAALAASVGSSVLLSRPADLDDASVALLADVDPAVVVAVGGESALSPALLAALAG